MGQFLSLVRQLTDLCEGEAGRYARWGATTQDVTDTKLIRQVNAAHGIILRDLRTLADSLADVARRERDTPMPGRTHGQHATPITFGFKVAIWLDEVRRHSAHGAGRPAGAGRTITGLDPYGGGATEGPRALRVSAVRFLICGR